MPLPPTGNRSTSAPINLRDRHEPHHEQDTSNDAVRLKISSRGFRRDYSIGETIRSPSHMIPNSTFVEAFQEVCAMKKHDFAFVKRSDGSYSYAILAFRSLEPSKDGNNTNNSLEEYMTFVVDTHRSIKVLKKEQWVEYIRPVKTRTKRKHQEDEWAPPSIIAFARTCFDEDDEFSLL